MFSIYDFGLKMTKHIFSGALGNSMFSLLVLSIKSVYLFLRGCVYLVFGHWGLGENTIDLIAAPNWSETSPLCTMTRELKHTSECTHTPLHTHKHAHF